MQWHDLPQDIIRRLDELGSRDLVIALPGCSDGASVADAVRTWADAIRSLPGVPSAVLLHADPAAEGDGPEASTPQQPGLDLVYVPLTGADRVDQLTSGFSDTVRGVFHIARRLEAGAVCVLGTLPAALSPGEISGLLTPVLQRDVDLVVPRYDAGPLDGLLGRGILYPLTRALFCRKLQDPMVLNFACSSRLAGRFEGKSNGRAPQVIWMTSEASCAGMPVGEARTRRPEPGNDTADLASVFRTVLGSLFVDLERLAACWQRAQASRPVPVAGEASRRPGPPAPPIDTDQLVESFHLAIRSLVDVWSAALPPASILELKKLAQTPSSEFRMPDALWARVVYDVALAYRLRVMNREHLLRSFVSLYLAWVASWATQATGDSAAASGQERLCGAFEQQKPYFLSRWRWPDRFSP